MIFAEQLQTFKQQIKFTLLYRLNGIFMRILFILHYVIVTLLQDVVRNNIMHYSYHYFYHL